MLTRVTITLIFTSLEIIFVEPQAFQVTPSNACVPCGGSTEFNCSTIELFNLRGGSFMEGPGGQMWRIQTSDGTVTTLSSNIPDMVPADYEFISPFQNVYTGLRVLNTNSTWNGTTFQCIAFDTSNVEQQNNSATAVTLEVGGPPQSFTCELQCPDIYRSGTSDHCTIMWESIPTVSCSSLQVSISLRQPDGTLVYSDVFSPNVTSTETTPLNPNTVYTVTITAENLCGSTDCSATTSTAVEAPAAFNVTAQVVFPSADQEQINVTWTPPGPSDPLVDSYTVNVSSTDGEQLCRSQTTGGNATSVVLDVTDCVICQSTNKSYAITVEASNRGGQTTAMTSLATSHIQEYQVQDISLGSQCSLNISCTVSDRTVATGCVFMYDSNGDGTLDIEALLNLPMMGNTAEGRIIIDCNLNQLNFTITAIAGTTLSTAVPLDCPISDPSFNLVSSRGDVTGQLTAAPPTCPNDTFTFTCNVTADINGFTLWRVAGSTTWSEGGNRECPLLHRTSSSSICGPSNVLTANSGTGFGASATSFTSTLSGTATPALNGTLVECFGLATSTDPGNLVGNGKLKVKAPPLPPEVTHVNFGDSNFTMTWRSNETVDGFNFSITPKDLRCTMNSMTTAICPYDMTHWGQIYTYSIAAYNCGNQRGDIATGRVVLQATVLFTEPKDATVKANGWAQFICTVHCDYQVNWYMAGHPNAIKRNNTVPGLLIKRRHASRRTETTHFFEVLATEAFNKSTFYCATNVRHQSCSCGTDGRCYSRPALLTVGVAPTTAPPSQTTGIPDITPPHSPSSTSQASVLFTDPKDVTVDVNEWAQFNCTVHCGYTASWYMAGYSSAIKRNNTVPGLLIKRRRTPRCTESNERTHLFEVLATKAFNKSAFYCAAYERRYQERSCSCGTGGRCYSRPALLTVRMASTITPLSQTTGTPKITISLHSSPSSTSQVRMAPTTTPPSQTTGIPKITISLHSSPSSTPQVTMAPTTTPLSQTTGTPEMTTSHSSPSSTSQGWFRLLCRNSYNPFISVFIPCL